MSSLPVFKPQEVVRHLEQLGFFEARQKGRTNNFGTPMDGLRQYRFTKAKIFRRFYCAKLRKTSALLLRCFLAGSSAALPIEQVEGRTLGPVIKRLSVERY